MSIPQNVCHRCRHKWKLKGGDKGRECPKCGSTSTGPTDPAAGMMPKVIVILVLAVAGAWYGGLIPEDKLKQAQDAVESRFDEVRKEVDERLPDTEGPKPRPEPEPQPKKAKAPPKVEPPQAKPEPKPKEEEIKIPLPKVVVTSRSSVKLGNSYLVKGKVKNEGGADADNVRVFVTFKGPGGDVAEIEARCPNTLVVGAKATYEAAVTGEQAEQTEDFSVRVTFGS